MTHSRIWSLWDLMEIFHAGIFVQHFRNAEVMLRKLAANKDAYKDYAPQYVEAHLSVLQSYCAKLKLPVATSKLSHAREVIRGVWGPDGYAELGTTAAGFVDAVIVELRSRTFLSIESGNDKFYTEPSLFGAEVDNAFPSASPEISEAGKCIACGRSTAAVFHLMRSLEVALRCVAKNFGVDFDNRNWENIINDIASKIKLISPATYGPDWKTEEQFYSEAAVQFRVLKNGWRNYAMHLHERYDPERALDIYNSVRAFMRHLAAKLHE